MKGVRTLPNGNYEVRYRDPTGKHRGKTFKKGEAGLAKAFKEEVSRGKRLGYLPQLVASQKTIDEVGVEWRDARLATLAPKTQKLYAWLWDALIRPHLAGLRLSELTPGDVETWLAQLDTGITAKRKAAALLHQVFNFGIKKGYVQANPVATADRPKLPSKGPRQVPSPLEVEQIRAGLIAQGHPRDALLVSVMAYGGGMRPQEALALTWGDVRDELVIHAPKTGRTRTARIFAPLRAELAAWKLRNGSAAHPEMVFPRANGEPWSDTAYGNWRNRVWKPAVRGLSKCPRALGESRGQREGGDNREARPGPDPLITPYALRHTYVSLCLRDPNISRVEAAHWAGHSLEVQDRTYAHVLAQGTADAEQSIRAARAEVFGEQGAASGEA